MFNEEFLMKEKERLCREYSCSSIQEVINILEKQWAEICARSGTQKRVP